MVDCNLVFQILAKTQTLINKLESCKRLKNDPNEEVKSLWESASYFKSFMISHYFNDTNIKARTRVEDVWEHLDQ